MFLFYRMHCVCKITCVMIVECVQAPHHWQSKVDSAFASISENTPARLVTQTKHMFFLLQSFTGIGLFEFICTTLRI